jgi:two-component system sensor histidine kinase YesM
VENFGDGEVGAIGNRFIEMAQRNNQLNKRIVGLSLLEKEAELKALQAQINPHFLYNSLAAMYWLAKFDKCAEVAQMAESLSDIFKFTLNKGRDMITVAEEIKYIQKYIDIQNIRYNNRIQTFWDIDASLMNQKMLKLILQPLVENAIYHGLEPQLGEWKLNISGHAENGVMLFTVSDNGVGMDVSSSLAHGFGINNVTERIRYKYGGEYGCDFQSSVGNGTTVSVRIPRAD